MDNAKIYKCFIASPSDVQEERDICDEVFSEINKTLGERFKFRVESLRWENASPSISNEPQAVINEQLLSQLDLFIGILYCRFGSPTKKYKSGTEEEFYNALEVYGENPNEVEIKMYFNNASISPSETDDKQMHNVKIFKGLVSESGCLYKVYNGADEFKEQLRNDLTKYFLELYQSDTNIAQTRELENRLQKALRGYGSHNITWVDRELCRTEKLGETFKDAQKIDIALFVDKPYSVIIKAPPQFGFTCLSHYLVLEAHKKGANWVYLQAHSIRHSSAYEMAKKECDNYGHDVDKVECIILDSWIGSGSGMMKILRKLVAEFRNIPIIVMAPDDTNPYANEESINIQREFEIIRLLPLTKNKMRSFVDQNSNIPDTDLALNRLIVDFNTLNIHRTPTHCLMLLKILENPSLGSPVNREKMLSMLLSVIFDFASIPNYSAKPDVEHCKFVLSSFCEEMINDWAFIFSKETFINHAISSTEAQRINIDVHLIFNILYENRIIIKEHSGFRFRNSFWVHYFAAQRMKFSSKFRSKILSNENYLPFIEMIEFYTGIEKSEDALIDLLINDLRRQCDIIENEFGIGPNIDPLQSLEWGASADEVQKSFDHTKVNVLASRLPDEVKDEYSDSFYNINNPYDQNIGKICEDLYFQVLLSKIKVCSRALRNSDFVDPSKKIDLLKQITRGWHLFSKLTLILTPLFLKHQAISFHGIRFILMPVNERLSDKEKIRGMILANPDDVIEAFYDDLFSERLSPLFFDSLIYETVKPINHLMILLLIKGKPSDWNAKVLEYIETLGSKSAHLLNILNGLVRTYKYDSLTETQLVQTKELIELTYTRKLEPNSRHLKDARKSLFSNKKRASFILPERVFADNN